MLRGPIPLRKIGKASEILQEIRDKLLSVGLSTATFTLAETGDVIEFDVLDGISVIDHGCVQSGIRCIACNVHPQLQYEFIVVDIYGVEHRPIGSTCILQRPLGHTQAERYGDRLVSAAKSYFRDEQIKPRHTHVPYVSQHDQNHERLFKEAGSLEDYLHLFGFEWIFLAQEDEYISLYAEDVSLIRGVINGKRYLRLSEYQRLCELTDRHKHNIDEERKRLLYEAKTPLIELFPYLAHKEGSSWRAPLAPMNGSDTVALEESQWLEYLQREGRVYTPTEWNVLARSMRISDRERIEAKFYYRIMLDSADQQVIRQASLNSEKKQWEVNYLTKRHSPLIYNEAFKEAKRLILEALEQNGLEEEAKMFNTLSFNGRTWIVNHTSDFLHVVRHYKLDSVPDGVIKEILNRIRDSLILS